MKKSVYPLQSLILKLEGKEAEAVRQLAEARRQVEGERELLRQSVEARDDLLAAREKWLGEYWDHAASQSATSESLEMRQRYLDHLVRLREDRDLEILAQRRHVASAEKRVETCQKEHLAIARLVMVHQAERQVWLAEQRRLAGLAEEKATGEYRTSRHSHRSTRGGE